MTESFVQQSTSLLRTASLRVLSGYAEGMPEYWLSVERLINQDGNSTLGYRVSLECAGTPLQHDLPELPNNNDLIELASILGKKVPALYPMLTTDEARHLAQHVLIILENAIIYTCQSDMYKNRDNLYDCWKVLAVSTVKLPSYAR